jgi:ABC-type polar amino acid transport system ATPase subunit
MLTARAIHKSFGDKTVLHGVDIDIAPGQITCLIGPSGTGKTTLLRTLALLDDPDRGAVSVDGDVYEFPRPPRAKREKSPWPLLTAVFQSLFLWPHLTLRENILLPARQQNPDATRDIEGLIRLFEMEHFIDHYPNEASLGQRQRVALARALILNPRYILLDEITSALDVEQTARILIKLSHLKERGIGVFLITHHIGFAGRAADQVIFMTDGKITEQGGPEILKNPETERLKLFLSMTAIAR